MDNPGLRPVLNAGAAAVLGGKFKDCGDNVALSAVCWLTFLMVSLWNIDFILSDLDQITLNWWYVMANNPNQPRKTGRPSTLIHKRQVLVIDASDKEIRKIRRAIRDTRRRTLILLKVIERELNEFDRPGSEPDSDSIERN